MNTNSVFDQNIQLYDDWFRENNHLFHSEIEAIKQLLPLLGEGIEIGIGSGIFSVELGIKYGIEPSEKMREKAIERGLDVIDAFAEKLPIANETYNFAIMITVDCFLQDVSQAFKEAWRILSSDGYFLIAFIDRETSLGRLYDLNKDSDSFYKQAIFHSAQEIRQLLKITGFTVVGEKQTVFSLENTPQKVLDGLGKGVFAVIKAKKIQ